MKRLLIGLVLLCILAVPVLAQDQGYENFAAVGASWNDYATPNLSGSLLWAQRLGEDDSTYSFNYVDVISKEGTDFSAAVSITTGIAQKLMTFDRFKVYGTTGVGILTGAENVGYAWTGGGAVAIPLGKGFQVLPNIRFLKSSLTDFQAIYGIMFGWGH